MKQTFFQQLVKHPALLWRLVASVVFIGMALSFWLVPAISQGLENSDRNIFATLLLLYGLYRLFTFYSEFKKTGDE